MLSIQIERSRRENNPSRDLQEFVLCDRVGGIEDSIGRVIPLIGSRGIVGLAILRERHNLDAIVTLCQPAFDQTRTSL